MMNKAGFVKKTAQILGIVEHYTSYKGISPTECLKNGFIVVAEDDDSVVNIDRETFDILKFDRGIFNHTLFSNFSIPENMSDDEYYTHQIAHYLSTYGREALGVGAKAYIPGKSLWKDLPETENVKVYFQVESDKFKERLQSYICSLRNPDNTLTEYYEYILGNYCLHDIKEDDINSYEIKAIYYKLLGELPRKPIDALRLLVYLVTGQTLLIKNKTLVDGIKTCLTFHREHECKTYEMIREMLCGYDTTKFASIFYRFKPIFLAFKGKDTEINHTINVIRKLAPEYHKPLEGISVQNIINLYVENFYTEAEVRAYLEGVDTRDIFKILNATQNANNIYKVYGIRNGKAFVSETNSKDIKSPSSLDTIENICISILKTRYADFKNKHFYIPDYIDYGLPVSEKDMVGAYTNGTKISIVKDRGEPLSIGVAWRNLEENTKNNHIYGDRRRVDIDLHMMSTTQHFGWDASRGEDQLIFSGDMTDAKDGAAEAFWIKNFDEDYVIDTRLYTGNGPVEMTLFANRRPVDYKKSNSWMYDDSGKGYIYDPNENVIPEIPLTITNKGLNIGLLTMGNLYLYNKSISSGKIPSDYYGKFIEGLREKLLLSYSLSSLLRCLGATVVRDEKHIRDDTIVLTPEELNDRTLFELFEKK